MCLGPLSSPIIPALLYRCSVSTSAEDTMTTAVGVKRHLMEPPSTITCFADLPPLAVSSHHPSAKPPGVYLGVVAYLRSYPSKMRDIFGFLTSVWHLVWDHTLIRKPVACYVVGDQGERRVCLLDEGTRSDGKRVGYRHAVLLMSVLVSFLLELLSVDYRRYALALLGLISSPRLRIP